MVERRLPARYLIGVELFALSEHGILPVSSRYDSSTVIGQSKCYASELIRLSCANIKQLCVKLEEESKQRMGSTGGT